MDVVEPRLYKSLARQVTKVQWEVQLDSKGRRESKDFRVLREFKAHKVTGVIRVSKASKASKVRQDSKDLLVIRECKVLREPKAS
jgi:hypothetical protein